MLNRDNSYLIGNKFAKGNKPNSGSFYKGIITWNKGSKGIMKPNKTSFKKGQKSITWKPVGSITKRIDKNNKERFFVKTKEPNIWVLNSVCVWTKNNGAVPKGFLIHHIDGNTLNDNIENLSLITRATHINIHRDYINSFKKYKNIINGVKKF